jgi:hypothetical protein
MYRFFHHLTTPIKNLHHLIKPILLLSTLPLPLTRILPIIVGHLLNDLSSLLDITPVMGFATVRLDGIGPSSRGLDGVFSAGTEVWG